MYSTPEYDLFLYLRCNSQAAANDICAASRRTNHKLSNSSLSTFADFSPTGSNMFFCRIPPPPRLYNGEGVEGRGNYTPSTTHLYNVGAGPIIRKVSLSIAGFPHFYRELTWSIQQELLYRGRIHERVRHLASFASLENILMFCCL
jgi:hypothetical protein